MLVTPVFASKYPPGHSLLLVPGVWLNALALIPILLAGLAGSLVFLLARRLANPWVAVLTWFLWTTSAGNLRFLTTYFSQNTTVVLWLAGWLALLRWRETRRASWLAAVAGGIAWQVVTRPFTAIPYAVPVLWIVLRDLLARRAWREARAALLVSLAILSIIPVWNLQTTGHWLTTPYALYSRLYFPYQRPGFGLPAAQPLRALPPDMAQYGEAFRELHAAYTPAMIPQVIRARLQSVGKDTWGDLDAPDEVSWGGRRPFLSLFAMIGALTMPAAGLFALATGGLEFVFHLYFAHPWSWSLYYLELQAPLAFLTASGLWTALVFVFERPRPRRDSLLRASSPRVSAAAGAVLALLAWPLTQNVSFVHRMESVRSRYFTHFRDRLKSLPSRRTMVFVRYAPDHKPERGLISNDPDLQRAQTWIVYDRGAENAKLQALSPDRVAYLYDEEHDALIPLPGTLESDLR